MCEATCDLALLGEILNATSGADDRDRTERSVLPSVFPPERIQEVADKRTKLLACDLFLSLRGFTGS
jgi:hypothetical protein